MNLPLVDDDEKLCRLVQAYLTPMGYAVTAVHTGPDGLHVALAGDFAAVIPDVMLPELDGFEVLKRLRVKSNVPVLMLTGLGEEADQLLTLTAVEFDLLYSLAKACGRVKTRERLLLEVAERDFEAFDRSIDVHISSIRKKLGDDARSPRFIRTIRGAGYMMLRP